MKKKLSILLCMLLFITMILPQAAFADDATITGDDRAQYYQPIAYGGAEMASEDQLRIYWADLYSPSEEYRISWKKADESQWNVKDVKISATDAASGKGFRSCLISGLEQNQQYDITVAIILTGTSGDKICGKPLTLTGYTYTVAPKYESFSSTSNGSSIESLWQVHEKNAVLKVYRADAKDGEYQLVGEEDGRQDLSHSNYKDLIGKVFFRDETVKPGKTYYYKAVSEVKLDDGSVMTSAGSKVYQMTSKRRPFGTYTGKLMNKKGTYSKSLTWKITADSANYKTKFTKKNITIAAKSSKTGKISYLRPSSVQYSDNGKKFYHMKSTLTLSPGKTVYLRINLKNKMWIRRDGADYLWAGTKYYYHDKAHNHTFTAHLQSMQLSANNKITIRTESEEDSGSYGPEDYASTDWERAYQINHHHGVNRLNDLNATLKQDKTVILSWDICPLAEHYLLRHGATEEEARASEPILIPKEQLGYTMKNLDTTKSHWFMLSEVSKNEEGKLEEELRPYGIIAIPEDGWDKVDYTYHPHAIDDLAASIVDGNSVYLWWDRCDKAKGYKMQYGTSIEAAKVSAPIIIDQQWWENYKIENLKKGETYYFILTELSEVKEGKEYEVYRPHGTISVTIDA